jgi:hypothetical protein
VPKRQNFSTLDFILQFWEKKKQLILLGSFLFTGLLWFFFQRRSAGKAKKTLAKGPFLKQAQQKQNLPTGWFNLLSSLLYFGQRS